jgi:hypothetical protein
MLEEQVQDPQAQASANGNLAEILGIFQSLKDSERQLIWNLMMMLTRAHRQSA